jgi:RNA polymerase sigma-70 factor (ECF subfamily)
MSEQMKNSTKMDSVDLEKTVLKFWPQINYRVRNSLGYTNPDWEDIASEVLIDIIEAIKKDKFRGESSLGTYIYVITSRRIIDYIRRKGKLPKSVTVEEQIPDPYDSMEKKEKAMYLADSIKKLKPRDADILYLYYYLGLSQIEIAGIFGISKRWVNTLIKNSTKSLKKILEK